MAGYTRQSTFTDGDIINAADSNDEFNQLVNTFSNTAGHKHDGTSGEGPVIGLIGDPGVATPKNKVVVDDSNERVGFFIDVSGTSTEQFRVQDGVIVPVTTNDVDLGTSSLQFKDLYLDGTATIDGLAMPTTTVTDILDEDNMASDSATALATQQSIKAYVDTQLTGEDLDFQGDSGGALSVDLDSQTFTVAGGTGIDTTGSGQTLTIDIDSTVATLTGTQTLTNKTLTSAVLNTGVSGTAVLDEDNMASDSDTQLATQQSIKAYVDSQITANNELDELTDVTITTVADNEVLAYDSTSSEWINQTAAEAGLATLAGTETLTNKTLTSAVLNTAVSGTAVLDEDNMASDSATQLATQQSIKAYVDTEVAGVTPATGNELENVVEDTTPQLGGNLDVNGNSIVSASNGNIAITPNGTGNVVIDGLNHPQADGTAGQFLKTDGAGQLAFDTVTQATGNELENVVEDTTPQLGGDLDVNGNKITSASNGDIDIEPNGTGNVLLGNFEFDVDQTVGAGQDDYVLTYDNATGHISLEAAAAGGISDVVSDTTPQLGGELDSNGNDIKMADDDVVILGTDSDALLSHDAGNNRTRFATDSIVISNKSGTNPYVEMSSGGNIDFYYGGTQTASVVSGGFVVVGNVNSDSVTIDNQGEVAFFEQTGNGSNSVSLKAPASVSSNVNFILPGSDGSSGHVLTTDGSGNLSFSAAAGGADGDGLAFAIALG